jgi:hypothetical protein
MTMIPRFRPQTMRYRNTVQALNAFLNDAAADTDREIAAQFQDAYDARLSKLNVESDFPAIAVPAWMGFKARYVSDLTGELIEPTPNEDVFDLMRDVYQLLMEVRDLVEAETGHHEERDRESYFSARPASRERM